MLLVLCAAAAGLDARSGAATALRARRPLWALSALRYEGQPAVIPPAVYLLVHDPHRRALRLALLPPGTRAPAPAGAKPPTLADAYAAALQGGAPPQEADLRMLADAAAAVRAAAGWPEASPDPLFSASLTLGPAARPASPGEARRRLAAAAADPLLWVKAPLRGARSRSTLSAWETASLLRALRALPPQGLSAARWPAPELERDFTSWLFEGTGKGDARGVTTLEVLNSGALPGVALKATKLLRLAGFDVVHFGNAPSDQAETAAVDRVGRPDAARAALAALGCRRAEVVTDLEAAPLTMASIAVGRDWEACAHLHGAGTGED
ncbi:MAG: LytR C-terminal domain-containing protein [Elusimicrobia bacterium]|nr:LytR C-terminal domain-containing protein [Elusimicrobiota bacterium]